MIPQGLWYSFRSKHWKSCLKNSQNVSLEKPRLSLSLCLVCLQFSLDILDWRSIEIYKTWEQHQQTAHIHALLFCVAFSFWQQQPQQQKHQCSSSFRIPTHQTCRLLSPTSFPLFLASEIQENEDMPLIWTCTGILQLMRWVGGESYFLARVVSPSMLVAMEMKSSG